MKCTQTHRDTNTHTYIYINLYIHTCTQRLARHWVSFSVSLRLQTHRRREVQITWRQLPTHTDRLCWQAERRDNMAHRRAGMWNVRNSVQVQSQESPLVSVQGQHTGRGCIIDLPLFEARASWLIKEIHSMCGLYPLGSWRCKGLPKQKLLNSHALYWKPNHDCGTVNCTEFSCYMLSQSLSS